MDMVVDKMHFRNHVDCWCKANCNPYDRTDLEGVSIQLLWDLLVHKNHFTCIVLIHINLFNYNELH